MISIIVPVYNGEAYLKNCLDSILKNTFRDFELIVVENGSTDGTFEIARSYAARDSRVKAIHTDVKGLSHARNVGIEASQGEYLAFVDADDYVSPYMYAQLYDAAVETGSDFVVCAYVSGREKDYLFAKPAGEKTILSTDEYYCRMYGHVLPEYSMAWNKLIHRDCLGDCRFDEDLIYFEDRNFASRCVCRAKKICRLSEPLYYYWRDNADSICKSVNQYDRMFQIYALQKEVRFMKEQHPDKQLWLEYLYCCMLQNADFRLKRAREEKLEDLQAELKPIVKDVARQVRHARVIPFKTKLRFLMEHYNPRLFLLAAKLKRG